jgi:hypothetical protein
MRCEFYRSSILLFSLFGWGAMNAAGQEAVTVKVIPRLGLTSPDSYFYEEFANFADDEPTEWTTGYLGRAAFVGLGLEVGREEQGIFLRGELAHTLEGWLSVVHGIIRPRVLFDPPEIVNTYLDVPAAITFASLQLILPTQFAWEGIRPYALFGGGGKWYHFGASTRPNEVGAILPSEGFTGALEVGGGLSFSLWGLSFDAQVRDTINRYWEKTQHDLVLSGALAWRIH